MKTLGALLVLSLVAACGGVDPTNRTDLRAAVDRAGLTLRQAVPLAISANDGGSPVAGSLVIATDMAFKVGAERASAVTEIRLSAADGALLSSGPAAPRNVPACTTRAIDLDAALAVAEAEAGGEVIAVVPDDDVPCAREIQVLSGTTLWEVKVGGDGAVLEKELSDEFSGSED